MMAYVLALAMVGGEDDRFPKGGPVVAIHVHRSGKVARAWGYSIGDGRVLASRIAVAGGGRLEVEGKPATLVRSDRGRDLALLKVDLGEHHPGCLADRPPAVGDRVHLPGDWPHGDGIGTVARPLPVVQPEGQASPSTRFRVLEFLPRGAKGVPRGMAVLDAAGNLAGLVVGPQPAAYDLFSSRHARFVCVSEIRKFMEGGHAPARR